jgi:hypothetical protein
LALRLVEQALRRPKSAVSNQEKDADSQRNGPQNHWPEARRMTAEMKVVTVIHQS